MKLNFCTLFNSAYLSRGITMYESLLSCCDDFHLYVVAFDEACYTYLSAQRYKHLTVISLAEFETKELLEVKPKRSAAEYCWTCSASTIYHCIRKYGLTNCTYLDADMLFYSNPKVLIDEMGTSSVLISPHRYTVDYDQSKSSGKYCVQFVCFKNTEVGMSVLKWWKDACIDWCYARLEDGKFGDQKYLDEFSTRFSGIHELLHLGGGLAPWNIQQYDFEKMGNQLCGIEKSSGKKFDVVFFHFHGLKFYEKNIVSLTDKQYKISKLIQQHFYFPYLQKLNSSKQIIETSGFSIDPHGNAGNSPYEPMGLKTLFRLYKEGIANSRRNVFGFRLKERTNHHYFFRNTAHYNS